MKAIREIKPVKDRDIAPKDILALLQNLGVSCSGYSEEDTKGSVAYSDRWELFDPEKVRKGDELPLPWDKVYEIHNRPNMKDCRDLRYRYVHAPEEILCAYPYLPVKGVFVLDSRKVRSDRIRGEDLVFIGNELV